ncbi:methyltransferase domain-containing protein [Novacetimonas pomaceti]|uniref:Methyltransferase n=1 Tax=Novacetimonas pomaceti TaxID=2021998 RepID=A0ABX5P1K0_9PROT|nr:methyltransferase domain-containing protein [Novacetimonas pomaceti]PYD47650.1 methyltransferase [Novacetimonas pomaceti]
MQENTRIASQFYASSRGRLAATHLRRHLSTFWPDIRGGNVLGVGYAAPYLSLWEQATCVSARLDTPVTRPGPAQGQTQAPMRECVASGTMLPFCDLFFDRVVMVHALEVTDARAALLRQVWKVMKDDARLLVVVPNRSGMWAHADTSPFGQGTPFSHRQITRALADACLRVERHENALYFPPIGPTGGRRWAGVMERAGTRVLPYLGGVCVIEAVKDAYAPVGSITPPGLAPALAPALRLRRAEAFSHATRHDRTRRDGGETTGENAPGHAPTTALRS